MHRFVVALAYLGNKDLTGCCDLNELQGDFAGNCFMLHSFSDVRHYDLKSEITLRRM
jgi:hypothetical protein